MNYLDTLKEYLLMLFCKLDTFVGPEDGDKSNVMLDTRCTGKTLV